MKRFAAMKKFAVALGLMLCLVMFDASATFITQRDFRLEVARGAIPGFDLVFVGGRNIDIDTGGFEDVWDGGGIWVAPTVARIHDLVSDSASDTLAGTGARTIRVKGLDGSGLRTEETLNLNGTTNVPTVTAYDIIYELSILSVGSGGENVGTITATAQTDLTVTAQINPTNNHSLMAVYQVPSDFQAAVISFEGSLNKMGGGGDASANLHILTQASGASAPFLISVPLGLFSTGTTNEQTSFSSLILPPGTTIKVAADSSVNNIDISAIFELLLFPV